MENDNSIEEKFPDYNIDPSTNDRVRDCLLGIVEDCAELKCSEAENKFAELEILLKNQDAEKSLLNKLSSVKTILNELKTYREKFNGYPVYFHRLEYAIGDIQKEFSKKTWEEPKSWSFPKD
jgi:hypothetical protein